MQGEGPWVDLGSNTVIFPTKASLKGRTSVAFGHDEFGGSVSGYLSKDGELVAHPELGPVLDCFAVATSLDMPEVIYKMAGWRFPTSIE